MGDKKKKNKTKRQENKKDRTEKRTKKKAKRQENKKDRKAKRKDKKQSRKDKKAANMYWLKWSLKRQRRRLLRLRRVEKRKEYKRTLKFELRGYREYKKELRGLRFQIKTLPKLLKALSFIISVAMSSMDMKAGGPVEILFKALKK